MVFGKTKNSTFAPIRDGFSVKWGRNWVKEGGFIRYIILLPRFRSGGASSLTTHHSPLTTHHESTDHFTLLRCHHYAVYSGGVRANVKHDRVLSA